MTNKNEKKIACNVYIKPEIVAAIKRMAAEEERSQTTILNRLLTEALKAHEQRNKQEQTQWHMMQNDTSPADAPPGSG